MCQLDELQICTSCLQCCWCLQPTQQLQRFFQACDYDMTDLVAARIEQMAQSVFPLVPSSEHALQALQAAMNNERRQQVCHPSLLHCHAVCRQGVPLLNTLCLYFDYLLQPGMACQRELTCFMVQCELQSTCCQFNLSTRGLRLSVKMLACYCAELVLLPLQQLGSC